MSRKWIRRRKRIFEIIEVGNDLDYVSRGYDYLGVAAIKRKEEIIIPRGNIVIEEE